MPIRSFSVDVDLSDFHDDALIEEMSFRGFKVVEEKKDDDLLKNAEWHISRGELYEAALELERNLPKLKGLSDLVNRNLKKG